MGSLHSPQLDYCSMGEKKRLYLTVYVADCVRARRANEQRRAKAEQDVAATEQQLRAMLDLYVDPSPPSPPPLPFV